MRMVGFSEIPEHWNWRWDGTPEGIIKIGKRASDLTRLGILHTFSTQDGYWPLDDPDPEDTKAKIEKDRREIQRLINDHGVDK